MYPNLGSLPFFGAEVMSHQAALVAAVLVCLCLGPRWAERLESIPRGTTFRMIGWIGLAAFAGARAHFVWNIWALGVFRAHPLDLVKVSEGMHAGGAIAALAISIPLVARAYGLSIGRFADAFAPTIGVGISLARVGCFLNGCCFGTPCHGSWCASFPSGSFVYDFHLASGLVAADATRSAAVHPLQLYFAGAALLATLVALWLSPRKRYAGQVGLVALVVYLVPSAVAELFRADYYPADYRWAGTLQFLWIAVALGLTSLLALAAAEILSRRHQAQSAPNAPLVELRMPQ